MEAKGTKTERLLLRPWRIDDAEALYRYASDPDVGPAAGWKPHESMNESREIIDTVFSAPETYAVVVKETNEPVGCVGLLFGENANVELCDGEAEVGYWIGRPFWGHGLAPEATRALMRHAFEDLRLTKLWCGWYEGNDKSMRVQEKCGFSFERIEEGVLNEATGETTRMYVSSLKKDDWTAISGEGSD